MSLADYNVLPLNFAKKIKGMAGYRNRLVHLYWNVKPEEVLKTLQNELSNFQEFIGHIEGFLAKQ